MSENRARSENDLEAFASALVRCPSVLGSEGAVAERVIGEMVRLGYDEAVVDDTGNAVGVVRGSREGPTLLFDAHMDTVDVVPRQSWSFDPFCGEIRDGRLLGRGSSDMKGALAAMVHAGARARSNLAGTLVVCASVGEELTEGAALRTVVATHRPDFVVIGEASELGLVRAGRGRAEFVIETRGRPSHASTPQQGLNAVHEMARLIAAIEAIPMTKHAFVGSGVMCLTDIISVPYPAHSVVPSGCRVTYERRLVPGDTLEAVTAQLHEAARVAECPDATIRLAESRYESYTGVKLNQDKWYPPWELPIDSSIAELARAGLADVGLRQPESAYQFCTNAALTAGELGVPTLGFGPSSEAHAHVVDEFLKLEELYQACRGYQAIAQSLLS